MQKGDQDLGEWLNGGRDEPVSEPHSGSSFLVAVVALVLVAGGVTGVTRFTSSLPQSTWPSRMPI